MRLVAEFERPGHPAYSVAALIDHNLGGITKDLFVAPDPAALREHWAERAEMVVVELTAQVYSDRISHTLATDQTVDQSAATKETRYLRPLVMAYLRDLPRPRSISVREVSSAARKRLLGEFRRTEEGRALGEDTNLASDFIAYGADYGSGDPLRWSPIVVELCLLDWFPRKVTLDSATLMRIPDVLRGWVRFAGARKALSRLDVEATVSAVDEFEAEYRDAMNDPSRFGPAKSIIGAMLAEGVPLTDQASLDAWLEGFHARPREERDRVLGQGLSRLPQPGGPARTVGSEPGRGLPGD